jgi:phosphocarrier protein
MVEEQVVIINKIGVHARPAALLVKTATGFTSEIVLSKEGKKYNAKSILTVMSAAIKQGDAITIQATGPDEQQALAGVISLIKAGFGE